jgi:hypothetical protein
MRTHTPSVSTQRLPPAYARAHMQTRKHLQVRCLVQTLTRIGIAVNADQALQVAKSLDPEGTGKVRVSVCVCGCSVCALQASAVDGKAPRSWAHWLGTCIRMHVRVCAHVPVPVPVPVCVHLHLCWRNPCHCTDSILCPLGRVCAEVCVCVTCLM